MELVLVLQEHYQLQIQVLDTLQQMDQIHLYWSKSSCSFWKWIRGTASVTIEDGVAIAATINNNGGNGYQVGDVVTISANAPLPSSSDPAGLSVGRNARFTLTGIGHTSQLILVMFKANLLLVLLEPLDSLIILIQKEN